jgi:pteridine reductase
VSAGDPVGTSNLAGKRALVTGAGKRVGRAIALALGKNGMHVALHHHQSASGADEACAAIRQAGGQAFTLAADLLDRDATRKLADQALEQLGGLDLLVGSAANFERIPFENLTDAAYDRALNLNLAANLILAERTRSALKEAQGSIVFVTCSSTATPFRNYLPYVVSKGALRQLTRVLALELAPEVRVNAVAPGTVLPPEDMSETALDRVRDRIPLARFGTAEDIAAAVLYLASAPFVTGTELRVDGGRSVAGFERFS